MNDWTFDAGIDQNGNFIVEAHSSSGIKQRIWTAVTRDELKDIRRTITRALNVWKQSGAAARIHYLNGGDPDPNPYLLNEAEAQRVLARMGGQV